MILCSLKLIIFWINNRLNKFKNTLSKIFKKFKNKNRKIHCLIKSPVISLNKRIILYQYKRMKSSQIQVKEFFLVKDRINRKKIYKLKALIKLKKNLKKKNLS
jgi:hypothetical protein